MDDAVLGGVDCWYKVRKDNKTRATTTEESSLAPWCEETAFPPHQQQVEPGEAVGAGGGSPIAVDEEGEDTVV